MVESKFPSEDAQGKKERHAPKKWGTVPQRTAEGIASGMINRTTEDRNSPITAHLGGINGTP